MTFQIQSVLIWPQQKPLTPRIISFRLNDLNIIIGENGTGKSSLLYIIDYCLGSKKCRIPQGVVRATSSWFGLIIQLNNQKFLIGRKCPKDKTTSTKCIITPLNIKPDLININKIQKTNTKRLHEFLDRKLRLDRFTHEYLGKVSARDIIKLCYQHQHNIANPFELIHDPSFGKFSTKKISHSFYYLFQTLNNETISSKERLDALIRELEKIEIKGQALSELSNFKSQENLKEIHNDCIKCGLIDTHPSLTDSLSTERLIYDLRKALQLFHENRRNIFHTYSPTKQILTGEHLINLIERSYCAGRILESLNAFHLEETITTLRDEYRKTQNEIYKIRNSKTTEDYKKSTQNIDNTLSNKIKTYSQKLNLPQPGSIHFNTESLSVSFKDRDHTLSLANIGSSHNWLSFNVATILSLFELAASRNSPNLPRFIIFDQPCQSYFMEGNKLHDNITITELEKFYHTLLYFINNNKRSCQIIVLDSYFPKTHSTQSSIIEQWNYKHKSLIPHGWLNETQKTQKTPQKTQSIKGPS